MKKIIQIFAIFVITLAISTGVVLAASLAVTSIGGIATTGAIVTFETSQTSPTLIGTAANDATVDIQIDDLTTATTADASGNWSYTPVNLTNGYHTVYISSNLETLTFTLTVNDGTTSAATSTASSTTTTTSTTSGELLASGNSINTLILISAGMFLIGLGIVAHQTLPLSETE